MALQREAEARLRGVRTRGRPRKEYEKLKLDPDDWKRLADHHAETFHDTVSPLGDRLTLKWITDYRAQYPDDWERMLRTLRKSGGTTTWTEATLRKKSKRDVPDQVSGDSILSDGDEPVYLSDLAHLMELYPGINGPQHRGRSTFSGGAYIDPEEIARPDYEIGHRLSAEVKRLRFSGSAVLEAIARDERECLEALHGRFWKSSRPIYVAFVPISERPNDSLSCGLDYKTI